MVKKILYSFYLTISIIFLYYLLSPIPTLPDLANSIRSAEPGDTVQLKNVAGFYTNLSRTEVMNFFRSKYVGPFRIILNHPPEKAKEVIRDTTQSYYLEEIVLPFKESLFINGFEWENDVFTKPEKRIKNQLVYQGKIYKAKVTLKTFPTSPWQRLAFFTLFQLGILGIFTSYRHFFYRHE